MGLIIIDRKHNTLDFSQILHFGIPIGNVPAWSLVEQIQVGGEYWLGLRNIGDCFHLHRGLDSLSFLNFPKRPEWRDTIICNTKFWEKLPVIIRPLCTVVRLGAPRAGQIFCHHLLLDYLSLLQHPQWPAEQSIICLYGGGGGGGITYSMNTEGYGWAG